MAILNIRDELHDFAANQAAEQGLGGAGEFVEALLIEAREQVNGHERRPDRQVFAANDFYKRHSLQELAAQQGVKPVQDFSRLLGDFWPDDETADEFIAAVRQWRRERSAGDCP